MTTAAVDLDYADTAGHGPSGVLDLLGTAPADLIAVTGFALENSTPEEARARRDRIRAALPTYVAMRQDIADAYTCGDWRTLGYPSWHAYVTSEFGELLAALNREERREAVADLRSQGMSTRQIAQATGTSKDTVARELSQSETPAPAKVTGTDGKSYPAAKPAKPQADPLPPEVAERIDARVAEMQAQAAVDAKLDAELNAAGDGTAVRFRANWSTAVVKATQIWSFSPDRIAEVYAADFDTEIDATFRQMERFIDEVREAHRKQTSGLRVLNGGRA